MGEIVKVFEKLGIATEEQRKELLRFIDEPQPENKAEVPHIGLSNTSSRTRL